MHIPTLFLNNSITTNLQTPVSELGVVLEQPGFSTEYIFSNFNVLKVHCATFKGL